MASLLRAGGDRRLGHDRETVFASPGGALFRYALLWCFLGGGAMKLVQVWELPLARLRPWVVGYCGLGGVAIMWLGGSPVQIVTPAALFGGVLTCGLRCLLMVWTDRRYLPRPLQMTRPLPLLSLGSGVFLTAWGVRGVINSLDQL